MGRGVRPGATILAVLQGKPSDADVILTACDVAKRRGGNVRALVVLEVPPSIALGGWDEAAEGAARAFIARAAKTAETRGCSVVGRVQPSRHAGQAILDEAADQAAAVIVVAKPYRMRTGEATAYLMERAHCDVLVWQTAAGRV